MNNIDKTMTTENETHVEETTITNEEEVEETTDDTEQTEETTEETAEQTIARLQKENHTLKIQKGKIKAKADRSEQTTVAKVELTNMDILAIAKSDVHEEDIDRVTKFAQMEGIAVKDALAHDDMQAILERRAEARKVAAASNTGANQGGQAEVTGDALLSSAKNGKMPDAKDLSAMWDAELKK